MNTALRRTFDSLAVRNYRLWFIGQCVSLAGTWMQQVAQALLVLKLTGSGTQLGLIVALQFAPVLVLGLWAGVVADRVPKRRLLLATQSCAALLALTLGVLVGTGSVRLWMVYALALALGFVQTFDNPARQSFAPEMVGPDRLANAVSLNSVMVNLARIVGPALAALLVATVGLAVCFLINAASYLAVITALVLMRTDELLLHDVPRERARLRDGLTYVRQTPEVLVPLLLMGAVGTFAYVFQVSLPLLADHTFHRNTTGFGSLSALQGVGGFIAGLVVAGRYKYRGPAVLSLAAFALGVMILVVAASPTFAFALAAIVLLGAGSISFIAIGNTVLQLGTEPAMRGRVMSLWSIAFMGTTPFGAPLVGWIGDQLGARYSVAVGGVAAITAAVLAAPALRRAGSRPARVSVPMAHHPTVGTT